MINPKYKKAFSMVTAIFVIFVMSSVTMLIMNVTGKTVKATTNQYRKEQAQLLARSYTELAIMYVIHYDRSSDCIESITDPSGNNSNEYNISINIKYIGNDTLLSGCEKIIDMSGNVGNSPTWTETTTGFYTTVSLVIDTFVTYKDDDDPSALASNGDRNITFHRRTLQKL
jgi:type II secretory pathway pseudopilin PulG